MRPFRSSVINGKRNTEAENKTGMCMCQRNRSCTAPSHAYQTQPTLSPLEYQHSIQVCPQVSPQGHYARLMSVFHPEPLVPAIKPPPVQRLQAHHGKVRCSLAGRIFTHIEVLASNWSLYHRPSVSSYQSLGSSGIREMGCFVLSLMLMCLLTYCL